MKQLVSFQSLDDSVHASIEQQIGERAAHHPKRHLHPSSTELVNLRAVVERDTPCSGDAYRAKLRLVLSTATRTAGEEAEHVADFIAFAGIPAYPLKRVRRTRYAGRDPRRGRRGAQQIFGFWQPDQTLKAEDALPGSGEEPEEAASEHADAFLRTVRGTGCHGNNGSIDVPSTGLPRFECSASPARKQGDIGISSGTDISTHPLPAREAMPSRTKRRSSWPSAVFVESPQPRRSRSPKTANAVS
ncbi:hypothetical protein PQR02_08550 [Paraburkholderia sediminicola]|uniref:Uncharacterized protein n=1 Tax=Paraburkholderia rhynchosiae TaxID=487049 RepID=A0ACC7NB62_9BURK